jgi:hypothetical protein
MKRVSQFDIYLLGMVRSLSTIKSGHRIADHRDEIVLSYVTLNIFCNDDEHQRLLPRSVEEARHLRATVGVLDGEMGSLSTGMLNGIVNDSAHAQLQRSLEAFDTTLKHELNSLPAYVIENTGGIYDTDALLVEQVRRYLQI